MSPRSHSLTVPLSINPAQVSPVFLGYAADTLNTVMRQSVGGTPKHSSARQLEAMLAPPATAVSLGVTDATGITDSECDQTQEKINAVSATRNKLPVSSSSSLAAFAGINAMVRSIGMESAQNWKRFGGHFIMRGKGNREHRIQEHCMLCFRELTEAKRQQLQSDNAADCTNARWSSVFGLGKNQYGKFVVEGTYNASTSKIHCTKRYVAGR